MKKKPLTWLLACAMIVGLFAGCGKQTATQGGGSPNSAQVLTVAVASDVNTWDISQFPDGDARFVWAQIYETLVRLDEDLNLIPGLAESWEAQDNGRVWIFHLRRGVKFHDGTPFTAEAVKYSYSDRTYVVQAKTLQFESIEAIDDYTVKFTCKAPVPLPTYLTHVAWPIASPTSLDAQGNFVAPIGTGPFRLAGHAKDQEIVVERYEEYWGERPKLEKVIFKIIPDPSTQVLALTAGDVDMLIKTPEQEVRNLEKDPNIEVYRKLTTFTDFLHFNCKREPFSEVNLRRAVAYAIDTESIVKNVLDGIGVAASGRPYSPVMLYSAPDLPLYRPDLEKAKQLLAAAGYRDSDGDGVAEKDGKKLKIDLLVAPSWSARELKEAEAVQAQLARAGFAVEVKQLESAALTRLENEGNFDLILRTGFFVWGPYPHHVQLHHSKNYRSHYANPAYDRLVELGRSTNDEQEKTSTPKSSG
ncbi:MAG: ABC transporter substrate-binding protein [Clostridia bacterium]|jgi:peptide/nickel transport system substrate-binding protein|nr:ABC transporter substrate-binding protein [Clostridia bacterium]MDH7573960.1 ABC transporter substrate-binding protein [Clostridia bacterium]